MEKFNSKVLIKSFLVVVAVAISIFLLAFSLTLIPENALLTFLGVGGFLLLWYIAYDILNPPNNTK